MAPAQGGKMFNNLVESSSHLSEFKRRGSFFLFTTATYVLLFAIAGVLSIYAYDARLEEPAIEITMLSPVELEPPTAEPVRPSMAPPTGANSGGNAFIRRNPTASVNEPRIAPETISATPNRNPPLPTGARFVVGNHDSDPGGVGPSTPGLDSGGGNSNGGTPVIDVGTPPPPIPRPKLPKVISKGVITGDAISLPKPAYPPMAKQMRIQGPVSVQVLIDESGRVISARAISGNPALVHAAQKAALDARFSPTRLSQQPVKVSGVITYNFVLQQ
jgi:periplasmic protein TonB